MTIDRPRPPTARGRDGRARHEAEQSRIETVTGPLPLVPVTDELEALEFLIDDDAQTLGRFAAIWDGRPSLVQIRARAQFHTDQLGRLLREIREGRIVAGVEVLRCAKALARLIEAANLATILIAPRDGEDYRAAAGFRRALRAQARRSQDPSIRHWTELTCGGTIVAMSEQDLRPARLPPASPAGVEARPGEAAFYPLELAASLDLWLETGVDARDLLDGARTLLVQVDTMRRVQRRLADSGLLGPAIQGATLLAYARLARQVLWPARDAEAVALKRDALALIGPRCQDGEHLRAVVEWIAARGTLSTSG